MLTRGHLLHSAAREFGHQGYAGASLQEVSRSAGVSMGALTFHFPTKNALATAVIEVGNAEARQVVDHAAEPDTDPLAAVARLTRDLVELLSRSPMVRAAARLENERGGPDGGWGVLWEATVGRILERARQRQELNSAIEPETVVQLTTHLLYGAAVILRSRPGGDEADTLARIWNAVLQGTRAPAANVS
ncbi:transcriptional regulator, TetR family [Actinopolyspora xinjiangensis]|uniref:Transcriptional regulator, TetR family n=1 Tax=Actinopolyspora xinjiangensis TaxID=405564 RepID=A0A1H0RH85_9ACTN|nr:TetR/AcrR family transcriptional regulator [Actinopolyspora xinjiangensis]SDP28386.1 transcriptional regulator, TetR family [Actinopolyspora xinjiangensis]